MSTLAPENTAFDRGVRSLLEKLLPGREQDVLSFEGDPALRARIEELASKSTEGELNESERTEYEGYVRANKFVAILKREARRMLAASN